MSEIWIAAAVGAVGSMVSARGAEKANDKQNTVDEATRRLMITEDRKTEEWRLKAGDYYQQKQKERKLAARANTFDAKGERLAGYTDKPRDLKFAGEAPKLPDIAKPAAGAAGVKKPKKPGLLSRLRDPLGIFG